MAHLVEAKVVGADWNTMTVKAERKKLQNRLNQRAHRRRKNQEDQPVPYSKANEGAGVVLRQRFFKPPSTIIETPKKQPSAGTITTIPVRSPLQIELLTDSIRDPLCPDPYPVPILPLSADHHLLTLIHYNVYRGLYYNKLMIRKSTNFSCAYIPRTTHLHPGHALPPTLTPTALQQTVPHQTWIDVFPSPVCRDNLILEIHNGRIFDFIELFKDLHGVFDAGTEYFVDPRQYSASRDEVSEVQPPDRKGMIVWGDAWNPANWEVTGGFLEKWGWLLKGCKDLMTGTNKWRALRDEPPLYW